MDIWIGNLIHNCTCLWRLIAVIRLDPKSKEEPNLEPANLRFSCSDSTRTRETLDIMQQQVPELLDADVRFLSSFYSVAAMDGETLQHLQEIICKYSKDDVTTIT